MGNKNSLPALFRGEIRALYRGCAFETGGAYTYMRAHIYGKENSFKDETGDLQREGECHIVQLHFAAAGVT